MSVVTAGSIDASVEAEHGAERPPTVRLIVRRAWIRAAGLFAVTLVVGVVVGGWVTHRDGILASDDAGYALAEEVRAERGTYLLEHPYAELDPDGDRRPYRNFEVTADGSIPYANHPLYVELLAAARSVFGARWGIRIVAAVGLAGAVATAWVLARRLRASPWLAALVVLASPVVVLAMGRWSHPLAAAGGGLALVLTCDLLETRCRWLLRVLGLVVVVALTALVRAEGVLFGLAVGVALGATGLRQRSLPAVLGGVGAVAASTAVLFLEPRWVEAVIGTDRALAGLRNGSEETSYVVGRISGAYSSLLRSYDSWDPERGLPVWICLAIVIWAALLLRRDGHHARRPAAVALLAAAALFAVSIRPPHPDLVTGLLPAWPAAVAGLVLSAARRTVPSCPVGPVAVVVALFGGLVLLTQYPEGGGAEWGGRFFAVATPGIGAVAALGLSRVWSSGGRFLQGALAAVIVVPSAIGLVHAHRWHAVHADQTGDLRALGPGVAVTDRPYLPKFTWAARNLTWFMAEEGRVEDVLATLDGHLAQVYVVTVAGSPVLDGGAAFNCSERVPSAHLERADLVVARLRTCVDGLG